MFGHMAGFKGSPEKVVTTLHGMGFKAVTTGEGAGSTFKRVRQGELSTATVRRDKPTGLRFAVTITKGA